MTDNPAAPVSLARVGRSAIVLTGGTAVAQVVTIVRELFVAAQVGASPEFDALLIALVLPMTLSGVLTSGAITALVPAYLEARAAGGPEAARRLSGTVLVWVGLAGLAVSVVLSAAAGLAVAVTGPGLGAVGQASAADYLRLLAPLAFVAAISAILYAVCQAEERFVAISASTLVGPAVTLVTMLVLWPTVGLAALAIGSLTGPIASLVILLVATVRAAVPTLGVRPDAQLRGFVRHAAPLTLGSLILQLNVIGDRAIASLLGPGSVSALRYAEVLVRFPIAAIGPAWGSAIYPALVRSALDEVSASLGVTARRMVGYALALFVPIAMLTAAVAPLAVAVAYGRGAFSAEDRALTAGAVAGLAPLLVILMAAPVLTGAHNARRRGRVVLLAGSLNVVINLTLDVVLGLSLGVMGIALASSVTSTIVVLFLVRRFTQAEDGFAVQPLARTLALAVTATAPFAIVAGILAWTGIVPAEPLPGLAALVAVGTIGLAGYAVLAAGAGAEEVTSLARLALARVRRVARPAERR